MTATTSVHGCPWVSGRHELRPSAAGSLTADVVVVGGGITGVTTALLLTGAGMDVVLCEAETVSGGVSGLNTAKVSALQATVYTELIRRHGEAVAATYATASMAGVEAVAELAAAHAPGSEPRRRPAATVATSAEEEPAVSAEFDAARSAGLPVRRVPEVDAPLPTRLATCLDDQLSIHPVRYVRGLADAVVSAGARVYEGSRVVRVHDGVPCVVRTADARIEARHVVVATHYPLLDRGLYFPRLEPMRSYCVAGDLQGPEPTTMAISAGEPTRSFAALGGLAVLGGEGHPAGARAASPERFERLAEDLQRWCQVPDVTFRWSAQDPVSYDRLPMIGAYLPGSDRLWVATGYGKWGLSTGTVAARVLTDLLVGRDNPWAATFAPTRLSARSLPKMARMNAKVAADLFGDRLRPGEVHSAADVPPGRGAVLRRGHRRSGLYRDDQGVLHAVSLRCTHLGCLLRFNAAEASWDCPCHGSRFGVDGEVLEGPAAHPLQQHRVEE